MIKIEINQKTFNEFLYTRSNQKGAYLDAEWHRRSDAFFVPQNAQNAMKTKSQAHS